MIIGFMPDIYFPNSPNRIVVVVVVVLLSVWMLQSRVVAHPHWRKLPQLPLLPQRFPRRRQRLQQPPHRRRRSGRCLTYPTWRGTTWDHLRCQEELYDPIHCFKESFIILDGNSRYRNNRQNVFMLRVDVLVLGFGGDLYLICSGSLFSVKYAIRRRPLTALSVEPVTTLCTSPALMPMPASSPEIFGSAKSIFLQVSASNSLIDSFFYLRCFPEADHIYYAQSNPTKLSIVEIGRVIQIVTGINFFISLN